MEQKKNKFITAIKHYTTSKQQLQIIEEIKSGTLDDTFYYEEETKNLRAMKYIKKYRSEMKSLIVTAQNDEELKEWMLQVVNEYGVQNKTIEQIKPHKLPTKRVRYERAARYELKMSLKKIPPKELHQLYLTLNYDKPPKKEEYETADEWNIRKIEEIYKLLKKLPLEGLLAINMYVQNKGKHFYTPSVTGIPDSFERE